MHTCSPGDGHRAVYLHYSKDTLHIVIVAEKTLTNGTFLDNPTNDVHKFDLLPLYLCSDAK